MRKISIIFSILCFSISVFAQTGAETYSVIDLWKNTDPPLSNDIYDEAKMYVYNAENNDSVKSPVVLIFPGGGYAQVSMPNEGHAFAQWLSSKGFTAVILKYRLPNKMKDIPFDDAQEALDILSEKADSLNIDLNNLGIAGFSAGGHMAAIFSNRLVNKSDAIQPVFNILFYPVISFEHTTKGGTRNNLLGENPTAELIREFSAQLQVTARTPKTIILVSDNDDSVPSQHSTLYYDELKRNEIPAALYIFPTGGHGWAMLKEFEYNEEALLLLEKWLSDFKNNK